MMWGFLNLLVTLCAGMLPCRCMLSGRNGPCDLDCCRAAIGRLLSERFTNFCNFMKAHCDPCAHSFAVTCTPFYVVHSGSGLELSS